MEYLWSVFVVLLMCNGCLGYSGGADPAACKNLLPLHGALVVQAIAPPYTIKVSVNTYAANDVITVTLGSPCTGNRPFKGFLIQARDAEDVASDPIGSFNIPAGTKHVVSSSAACGTLGTQSLTHSSSAAKTEIVTTWTAPASSTKHIVFVATFVVSFDTVFQTVYSESVELTGKAALVPPASPTFPTLHDCPAQVTQPPAGSLTMDADCGVSKSCFVDCEGDSCSFVVSWKTVGTDIEFSLAAGVSGSDDLWIALGFSEDSTMGSDGVIDCTVSGANKEVRHSKNGGKDNTVEATLTGSTSVALADSVLRCTVTVPQTNNIFVHTQPYTLFFAMGKTGAGTLNKNKHSDLPVVSTETADLRLNNQVLGAAAASVILVKTHGSLMITAWVFLASFGLVVARYYKKLGGSRRWCDVHIWFVLHRVSMITTFLLAAIAFIIIFVDVKGYSAVGQSEGEEKFLQAHPILGIISTGLVVLNPIMAIVRPHPDSPNRSIFNWAHWAVGTTAWIISIVTIFIGFEITKSGVHPYTVYVMAGFVVYQLVMELILEVHGCMQQKAAIPAANNEYEMKAVNGRPTDPIPSGKSSGAGVFRSVLLVAHGVILFCFLVALLYMVNAQ